MQNENSAVDKTKKKKKEIKKKKETEKIRMVSPGSVPRSPWYVRSLSTES